MHSSYFLVLAAGLVVAGCGGGSGSGSSSPSVLSITPYTVPAGTGAYQFYVTAVDDNGASYGSLGPVAQGGVGPTSPAAYWPTPSTCVTVPVIDSTVVSETLVGKSPGGAMFVGYTFDANNSIGPGRGFVYTPATQQFHILVIPISGATLTFCQPAAVSDAGVVTGFIGYRLSSGQGGSDSFTYNLSDDTFQLTANSYPHTVGAVVTGTFSQNMAYFTGQASTTAAPTIYTASGPTLVSADTADTDFFGDYVSNDASVSVIERAQFGGSSGIVQEAKIWFPGRGTVSTYALEQKLEPGVFNGTAFLTGSPLGHYVTIGNVSEGGSLTRLVHVK